MVYEKGMRVGGVSPVEYEHDLRLPADERIEHAMLDAEKYIPAGGPVVH
jgi:hypothetical protein